MSYNIDRWNTKKLDSLAIPLEAFYRHQRTDFHPSQPMLLNAETMQVELECGCEQTIQGTLKDGVLTVTGMDMGGEGSGTFYHDVFIPALEESTGELEAVLVWEGGDSITRLTVNDGEVTSEDVEL